MDLRETLTRFSFLEDCIIRLIVDIFTNTAASTMLKPRLVNQLRVMHVESVGSYLQSREGKRDDSQVREISLQQN